MSNEGAILCRLCQGPHWTMKCLSKVKNHATKYPKDAKIKIRRFWNEHYIRVIMNRKIPEDEIISLSAAYEHYETVVKSPVLPDLFHKMSADIGIREFIRNVDFEDVKCYRVVKMNYNVIVRIGMSEISFPENDNIMSFPKKQSWKKCSENHHRTEDGPLLQSFNFEPYHLVDQVQTFWSQNYISCTVSATDDLVTQGDAYQHYKVWCVSPVTERSFCAITILLGVESIKRTDISPNKMCYLAVQRKISDHVDFDRQPHPPLNMNNVDTFDDLLPTDTNSNFTPVVLEEEIGYIEKDTSTPLIFTNLRYVIDQIVSFWTTYYVPAVEGEPIPNHKQVSKIDAYKHYASVCTDPVPSSKFEHISIAILGVKHNRERKNNRVYHQFRVIPKESVCEMDVNRNDNCLVDDFETDMSLKTGCTTHRSTENGPVTEMFKFDPYPWVNQVRLFWSTYYQPVVLSRKETRNKVMKDLVTQYDAYRQYVTWCVNPVYKQSFHVISFLLGVKRIRRTDISPNKKCYLAVQKSHSDRVGEIVCQPSLPSYFDHLNEHISSAHSDSCSKSFCFTHLRPVLNEIMSFWSTHYLPVVDGERIPRSALVTKAAAYKHYEYVCQNAVISSIFEDITVHLLGVEQLDRKFVNTIKHCYSVIPREDPKVNVIPNDNCSFGKSQDDKTSNSPSDTENGPVVKSFNFNPYSRIQQVQSFWNTYYKSVPYTVDNIPTDVLEELVTTEDALQHYRTVCAYPLDASSFCDISSLLVGVRKRKRKGTYSSKKCYLAVKRNGSAIDEINSKGDDICRNLAHDTSSSTMSDSCHGEVSNEGIQNKEKAVSGPFDFTDLHSKIDGIMTFWNTHYVPVVVGETIPEDKLVTEVSAYSAYRHYKFGRPNAVLMPEFKRISVALLEVKLLCRKKVKSSKHCYSVMTKYAASEMGKCRIELSGVANLDLNGNEKGIQPQKTLAEKSVQVWKRLQKERDALKPLQIDRNSNI